MDLCRFDNENVRNDNLFKMVKVNYAKRKFAITNRLHVKQQWHDRSAAMVNINVSVSLAIISLYAVPYNGYSPNAEANHVLESGTISLSS